jgi:hypothetical protein
MPYHDTEPGERGWDTDESSRTDQAVHVSVGAEAAELLPVVQVAPTGPRYEVTYGTQTDWGKSERGYGGAVTGTSVVAPEPMPSYPEGLPEPDSEPVPVLPPVMPPPGGARYPISSSSKAPSAPAPYGPPPTLVVPTTPDMAPLPKAGLSTTQKLLIGGALLAVGYFFWRNR